MTFHFVLVIELGWMIFKNLKCRILFLCVLVIECMNIWSIQVRIDPSCLWSVLKIEGWWEFLTFSNPWFLDHLSNLNLAYLRGWNRINFGAVGVVFFESCCLTRCLKPMPMGFISKSMEQKSAKISFQECLQFCVWICVGG